MAKARLPLWKRVPVHSVPALVVCLILGCPGNDEDPIDLDALDRQPCPGPALDAVFLHADGSDVYSHLKPAGDLDGDGCADLLLGDNNDNTWGNDSGAVAVFYAPVAGTVFIDQAHALLLGEHEDDDAGWDAVGVGDTDGDGFGDVLVGAPRHPGHEGPGAAYLVRGPMVGEIDLGEADAKMLGEDDNDQAGGAVAAAGDVDGDGRADLLIGARYAEDGGRAYLLYGPVWSDIELADADARLLAEPGAGHTGEAVDGAGDVDGDGFDDLLIGDPGYSGAAHSAGIAYLVRGPVSGDVELADADARLLGIAEKDDAGSAVAGAGDVNGDGFDDVLIGARNVDGIGDKSGEAYLLLGPLAGDVSLADADATLTEVDGYDHVGYAVDGGGDVNGDGLDDVLIGAPGANAAYLLHGPLAGTISLADADVIWQPADLETGAVVALLGDTNGDGFDDVGITATAGGPASGPGWWGGAAYLFVGE